MHEPTRVAGQGAPAGGGPTAARSWPLYVGGFLGPFGGSVVTPMLPELRDGLHTSLATAASSLTAYMIPFAALMIVSGTLAERWGRGRSVQVAYVGYALASLVCAAAPDAGWFLAGRGLQGASNAFTSPLLVAAISDLVGRERLSGALGRYGSFQAAGQAFAPLVGGAASAVDYRWAFVASALVAALLATMPPRDVAPTAHAGHTGHTTHGAAGAGAPAVGRWRSLLNRRLVVACAVAFGLYVSSSGLTLLVALQAGDRFGLGPDARGLVVAAFGVAGLATGARFGRLADRIGARRFAVGALLVLVAAVAAAGLAPTVALLTALVALGGATSTGVRVVVNTLAVTSTPGNRGGATSMTLAWQFLGSALAPLALIPIYHRGAPLGFLATASGAVAALLVLPAGVSRRAAPATPSRAG